MIEDLQADNREGFTKVVSSIMNLSMRLEQEKAIQAGHYERNDDRAGQRNGFKSRTIRTRIGEIPIEIPQVRGMEFYPGTIEKGCRSERALKLAIAQMYKNIQRRAYRIFQRIPYGIPDDTRLMGIRTFTAKVPLLNIFFAIIPGTTGIGGK